MIEALLAMGLHLYSRIQSLIPQVFPRFKDIVPLEECFEAAGVAFCGRLLCQVAFAALFFYYGQLFRL